MSYSGKKYVAYEVLYVGCEVFTLCHHVEVSGWYHFMNNQMDREADGSFVSFAGNQCFVGEQRRQISVAGQHLVRRQG